jgi:transglutaminase-like putative cysteine protease
VLPDTELRRGDIIAIDAEMLRPTVELLRNSGVAGADPRYLEMPDGLPSVVVETAQNVAAGAATDYDKAIALQAWFRSNFAYDTDVNFGSDKNAIADFIAAKRGFCQQFAGTFAVMARALGLPSRVAVGFTAGELRDDGLYHVYGRHAHAWPEVWFAGLGWVAFEPTPGRGNADTAQYTGVEGQQATGGATGGPTGSNPGGSTSTTNGVRGTAPEVDDTSGAGTGRTTTTVVAGAARGGGGGPSLPWVLTGVVCLLILWVVAAPRVVRAVAHRHDETAADRVVTAWRRTLGVLALAGAPAVRGATPIEYALIAKEATGIDHRALREIALHVTTAVYSPTVLDDATAERCDLLAHEIDVQCRDRIPTGTRAQALFDLRLMRRRYAG